MNRVSIVFCISFLISTLCRAQDNISVSGEVFSKFTNEPLSFASITIKGKPVGTAANELGQFTLHFPNNLMKDTLYITSLGFKPFIKPVWAVLNDSLKTFHLDTASIPIQPIYVLSNGATAEEIVKQSIKNIRKNYPTRMYYLEVFYRELSMRDDKYARLVEAAASIQDFGYDADIGATRIRVNEIRKSNNYLEYDRTSKMIKKVFGETNLLFDTYGYDFIRAIPNCSYENFLCNNRFQQYEFKFEGCTTNENGFVYKISVRDSSLDSKIKNRTANIEGILYIQSGNYAILRLDYGLVSAEGISNPYFFQGKYLVYTSTNYKPYNGKYFPDIIRIIKPILGGVANRSDSAQGNQYTISTLMINNILTRRKDFSRIKDKDKKLPNVDIYEEKFPYNPNFWLNYNIVLLNPNIQSVNYDLQREMPLEEQFKKNGK